MSDNKSTYSNDEDVREEYMLKAPSKESSSIFKSMYNTYFNNIIFIDFINDLDIPEDAIEVKDASVSNNEKIKSWIIKEGNKYKLYIGSEKIIYAIMI